ncbi:MAG: hypothetical protein ACLU38_01710 [Dysosmobacter sp.]
MAGQGGVKSVPAAAADYGIRIHRDAVDLTTCRSLRGGRLAASSGYSRMRDLDQLCCRADATRRSPGERAAYDRITVSLVYPEPGNTGDPAVRLACGRLCAESYEVRDRSEPALLFGLGKLFAGTVSVLGGP